MQPLKVGPILDRKAFAELRRTLELEHHKWDAQVGDETAIAPFPLLVAAATWAELADLAERLAAETVAIEEELLHRPDLHASLGLPRALRALLGERKASTPAAARVMRFDFHPTPEGWRVSEVNSDVPGGYSEASELARLLAVHTPGARVPGDPGAVLVDKLVAAAGEGAIALLTAPWHIADHQVVAHLAARIEQRGTLTHLASPLQLVWRDGRASLPSALDERPLGAILRFFQVEWLPELGPRTTWEPLLVGGRTKVANPVGAALSESKRVPLVFDALTTKAPTWRRVLPETRDPRDAPLCSDDGWLLKAAYSNNGDTVTMRGITSAVRFVRHLLAAHLTPDAWVAQRRFEVVPVESQIGRLHACVGVYTIDGAAAGAYARVTRRPFIDFAAYDAALLIEPEEP